MYWLRLCAGLLVAMSVPVALAQSAADGDDVAGASDEPEVPASATSTIGPRNPPLYEGARAFNAGDNENGIRLTLEGLSLALGRREEEAALSNLCTGYLRLRQFDNALTYCDRLLNLNDKAWRAYNSRAMIYLELEDYEKADQDLKRAEAINPSARTVKVARAMYMDTVHPVAPAVEIDDR
jgi:tetratricopeptide (TPR) repeat protein